MDNIVQIVIFIIIIGSIAKRFKEVANKGEEIKSPPPVSPKMPRREQAPRPPRTAVSPGNIPREREMTGRELFQTLFQQEMPPEIPSVQYSEPEIEEYFAAAEEYTAPVMASSAVEGKASKRGVQLNFGASEVVRGFVMGEILAPPVSMREA